MPSRSPQTTSYKKRKKSEHEAILPFAISDIISLFLHHSFRPASTHQTQISSVSNPSNASGVPRLAFASPIPCSVMHGPIPRVSSLNCSRARSRARSRATQQGPQARKRLVRVHVYVCVYVKRKIFLCSWKEAQPVKKTQTEHENCEKRSNQTLPKSGHA